MCKVRITQEQADAIEFLLKDEDKETIIKKKANEFVVPGYYMKKERDIIYREMGLGTLIKSLYIGYEVKPEFKKNDWAHVNTVDTTLVSQVMNVYDDGVLQFHDEYIPNMYITKDIRHATPEEIAEEKQRRFWSENGREVGEYKMFDLLEENYTTDINQVMYVRKVRGMGNEEKITLSNGRSYNKGALLRGFRVACFSHDRKDIKHD